MKNRTKSALFGIISAFILFWGTMGGTASKITQAVGLENPAGLTTFAFAASPSTQPASFRLRTGFAPTMGYSPFYVAQELFWPKLNLDGTALPGKGSAAAVQTVAAGSEQMGFAAAMSVMNGVQEGMPVKIIAVIQRRDPSGIIFMKDSGIRDLKDLIGKRIGNFALGFTGPLLQAALRLNGVDEKQVQIVNVPPGGTEPLLLGRKIDSLMGTAGSDDTRLRCEGHEATSIPLATFGLNFYGQAVFINTKWADQVGDEVVSRALLGIVQGSTFVKQDTDQAIRILQKLNPQVQVDRINWWAAVPTFIRWSWYPESPVSNKQGFGWIDEAEMAKTQKILVEAGLLKKETDIEAYYTNKYLKDARVHQAAVELVHTPWPETPEDVKKKCGL